MKIVAIYRWNAFLAAIVAALRTLSVEVEEITIPSGTTEVPKEIADQIDRAIEGKNEIFIDKTMKKLIGEEKLEYRHFCYYDFQNIIQESCPFSYTAEGFRLLYRAIAEDAFKNGISAITVILCPLDAKFDRGGLAEHGLILDNGSEICSISDSKQMTEIFTVISEEFLNCGIVAHPGVVRYSSQKPEENGFFVVDDINRIEISKGFVKSEEVTRYHIVGDIKKTTDRSLFMDRHLDEDRGNSCERIYAKQEGAYVRIYCEDDGICYHTTSNGTVLQNEV
ncbi:MAG: hypothetical protein WCX88_02380, partial [Patescibacteria group bacterium]